ncbi:tetratricopeptide repeat protein [Mucilaginibacter flavus]|uniref:tetratricopeptide repeat protein n=1 Tax=Mucilaginibacter flavus TaxID=931504 RepID=UPI0025B55C48|nr:tetratricopeptide repeat protein [Mucilaginibacter flavus]MDN3581658.1 tetratricopeptide repeat protein [Mucilaginibacter flavus]
MKYFLLVILCSASISASAQWWQKPVNTISSVFKKHERFPQIDEPKDHSIKGLPVAQLGKHKISNINLQLASYSLYLQEMAVMKTAQHNMRFRVYNAASYNFSDLAQMYLKQNRLSEAKWYLLQSLQISRQQNDDRHTISNLIGLATVKAGYGDYTQAMQDLDEARNMAASHGLTADVATVNKQARYLQDNKSNPRAEIRYAETDSLEPKKVIK